MRQFFLALIRGYQRFVSPMKPPTCRFYPTCSSFAHEAIEKHGVAHGARLSLQRVLRCHPWHPGGYDPVPERTELVP